MEDQEIADLIMLANTRKLAGDVPFRVVEDPPDWYIVRIPVTAHLEQEEAVIVLSQANRAKEHENADVVFTFQNGRMVKNWITLKGSPTGEPGRITIGGNKPREF